MIKYDLYSSSSSPPPSGVRVTTFHLQLTRWRRRDYYHYQLYDLWTWWFPWILPGHFRWAHECDWYTDWIVNRDCRAYGLSQRCETIGAPVELTEAEYDTLAKAYWYRRYMWAFSPLNRWRRRRYEQRYDKRFPGKRAAAAQRYRNLSARRQRGVPSYDLDEKGPPHGDPSTS